MTVGCSQGKWNNNFQQLYFNWYISAEPFFKEVSKQVEFSNQPSLLCGKEKNHEWRNNGKEPTRCHSVGFIFVFCLFFNALGSSLSFIFHPCLFVTSTILLNGRRFGTTHTHTIAAGLLMHSGIIAHLLLHLNVTQRGCQGSPNKLGLLVIYGRKLWKCINIKICVI